MYVEFRINNSYQGHVVNEFFSTLYNIILWMDGFSEVYLFPPIYMAGKYSAVSVQYDLLSIHCIVDLFVLNYIANIIIL